MARAIKSPGVQIIETDLSNYQEVGGGTNVFLAGFAPQGPTDETLLVTTIAEFERVYGTPETAAERYFYHSAKEVLNSPATLLTTRLPYGSGDGEGYADQYSALIYPVGQTGDTFTVLEPSHITLTDEQYEKLIQGDISWSTIGVQTTSTTIVTETSSLTVSNSVSSETLTAIQLVDPTPDTYGVYYNDDNTITFTFQVTSSVVTTNTLSANYNDGDNIQAGLVVVNSSKTAQNERFEGYYISVTDNSEFGPTTDFTAVSRFYGLTDNTTLYEVPQSRLGFTLSAEKDQGGAGSLSEIIEGVVDYNLNQNYYNDTLVLNVFKVRSSIYEPQTLTYSLVETHLGSLDYNKKELAPVGGIRKSFFLETSVNNTSNNIKVFVNPNLSKKTDWASLSSNEPSKNVRTAENVKAIYPTSVFKASYNYDTNKVIGSVPNKLARVLSFVETSETVLLDVVVDGGLTTVWANTSGGESYYDDEKYLVTTALTSTESTVVQNYKTTFDVFNNFVENIRKDCVFIADPLRQIFVNGENTKVYNLKNSTFSQDIYKPLQTIFGAVNSNYSVTYGNWVKSYDPFVDKQVWLPFSGFAAAIYARTDTFAQPWIAPAGLTRGIIPNVTDLAFNPNQKQRDFLYSISVNPVVFFSGDGYVVFGQKTLQNKPSAFDRVNVRRLFLALERSTQSALKYFVFEPNTEFTRTRLKSTIVPILELAKNTQGLYDYLIVCDERNNTPDVIDRNELAVDIYIKPVKAAEFILVNFIATRTGQDFQELI